MDAEIFKHLITVGGGVIGTGIVGGVVTMIVAKINTKPAEMTSTADATAKLAVNSLDMARQLNEGMKAHIDELNQKLDRTEETLDLILTENRRLLRDHENLLERYEDLAAQNEALLKAYEVSSTENKTLKAKVDQLVKMLQKIDPTLKEITAEPVHPDIKDIFANAGPQPEVVPVEPAAE